MFQLVSSKPDGAKQSIRRRLKSLFDRSCEKYGKRDSGGGLWFLATLTSPGLGFELADQDDALIVRAALPGLEKKDVQVEVTKDRLVVRARKNRSFEAPRTATIDTKSDKQISLARSRSLARSILPA